MKNEFDMRKMIVASKDNEIVAFAEYTMTNEFSKDLDIDCELCGLYLKNEYLKKGIGTKLFNYIRDIFIANGKHKMGLWCLKDNAAAIKFYEDKNGMKIKEKNFNLVGKEYTEIAFLYDLMNIEEIK